MTTTDRRVHARVHFTVEDGVSVLLERTSPDGVHAMLVSAFVLNLSEGGMAIIGRNPALMNLKPGDTLTLVRMLAPEELAFLKQVELEVRHALYEEETEHILAGCRFVDLSPEAREQIARFVSTH